MGRAKISQTGPTPDLWSVEFTIVSEQLSESASELLDFSDRLNQFSAGSVRSSDFQYATPGSAGFSADHGVDL